VDGCRCEIRTFQLRIFSYPQIDWVCFCANLELIIQVQGKKINFLLNIETAPPQTYLTVALHLANIFNCLKTSAGNHWNEVPR